VHKLSKMLPVMLVMGAIDPGDFERLFARARAES
jgi:hypothetical protein